METISLTLPTIDVTASAGITSPESFIIKDISLITNDGSAQIQLKPSIMELSIYEELFSPMVTGHVTITDSQGFIEKFDIAGFNFIKISFSKTEGGELYEKYFKVYKVGERTQNSRTNEAYTLFFCSEELFISEQTKVVKSYQNMTISEMITDIIKTNLGTNKIGLIEDTDGVYSFIVPNFKPYEAISWLSTYAKPSQTTVSNNFGSKAGADMIFYQNKLGFNFRSLQSIFSNDVPLRTYHYSIQNTLEKTNLDYQMRSIKSYRFVDTFDSLKAINNGVFANKLISLDPLLRTQTVTEFKYDDYISKNTSLTNNKITTDYKNRFEQTVSDTTDAVLKVVTTNAEQRNYSVIKDDTAAFQSVAPSIDIETFVPYRTAQLALINYSKLEVSIPGDPTVMAGSLVNVNLPSMNPGNDPNQQSVDKKYSGKWLVSAVRHKMDIRGVYITIMELVRDGVTQQHTSYVDNDFNITAKNS